MAATWASVPVKPRMRGSKDERYSLICSGVSRCGSTVTKTTLSRSAPAPIRFITLLNVTKRGGANVGAEREAKEEGCRLAAQILLGHGMAVHLGHPERSADASLTVGRVALDGQQQRSAEDHDAKHPQKQIEGGSWEGFTGLFCRTKRRIGHLFSPVRLCVARR